MTAAVQGRATTVRPWRPVRRLAVAHALSVAGNVVLTVAIPWLVLTVTGSAAQAGLALFAGVVGATVGGLAAGRVVQKVGAVRASALADVLSALAVVPLPVLLTVGVLEVRHVVLLAVVGALGDSAGWTARQALVPVVADESGVPRERANARFTSAEHVGYLLGAPAAGVLITVLGVGGTLWATVSLFAVAALVIRALPELRFEGSEAPGEAGAGMREVFAFIWADPVLRSLMIFPTASVVVVGPLVQLVLPVIARQTFDDPVVLGLMVSSFGIGGLLGATTYGAVGAQLSRRALYAAIFMVWPLSYVVITLSRALPVTLGMLAVLGAAAGAVVPLQATVRQERSPAHLLPRVVGLSTVTLPVAVPIGVLVTGVLIDGLGLRGAMLVTSAVAVTIGATVLSSRAIRLLDDPPAHAPSSKSTGPAMR
jgi:predicted MFS family arabinose efflux permease